MHYSSSLDSKTKVFVCYNDEHTLLPACIDEQAHGQIFQLYIVIYEFVLVDNL